MGESPYRNISSYNQKRKPKAKDIRDKVRAVLFHMEKDAGKDGLYKPHQKTVLDYINQWNNFQSLPSLSEILGELVKLIPEANPHS